MKESINIGALDPQQRLDVARGNVEFIGCTPDNVEFHPCAQPTNPHGNGFVLEGDVSGLTINGEPMEFTGCTVNNGPIPVGVHAGESPTASGDCVLIKRDLLATLLSAAPVPPVQCQHREAAPDAVEVLRAVQEQFNRFGERFPDGFDGRVFRWVDDAVAAYALCTPQPLAQVDECEAFEAAYAAQVSAAVGDSVAASAIEKYRGVDGYPDDLPFLGKAWGWFRAGATWQRTQASPAPSADGGKVESDEVRRMLGDTDALEGCEEWLRTQELTINVGEVELEGHDTLIESTAGWLLRLVEAALSAQQPSAGGDHGQ